MLLVGLVINNIQRQFPVYWWTPLDLRREKKGDEETVPDATGGLERRKTEEEQRYSQEEETIEITGAEVILPDDLSLNKEEAEVLEKLRKRLRKRVDARDSFEQDKDREKTEADSARSSTEFTMVPSRSEGEARSNSGSTCST